MRYLFNKEKKKTFYYTKDFTILKENHPPQQPLFNILFNINGTLFIMFCKSRVFTQNYLFYLMRLSNFYSLNKFHLQFSIFFLVNYL